MGIGVRILLVAIVSTYLLHPPTAKGEEVSHPLEGRWNLTVEGPNGNFPAWLEIRRSGVDALVGSYVGQFGSARPIGEIEARDTGFRFSIPTQWERTPEHIVYEGQLTNGKLSGETNGGTRSTWKWTGERAPKLERTEPPVWGPEEELFNQRDLQGWKPHFTDRENGWVVQNGLLSNVKPGNDLLTERTFNDFKLSAEFRYPKGSNSGIYLRGRYEVQIEDNFGEEADSHKIGGIYGHLTPSINASKLAGEWQTYEITLIGRSVTVVLNGERIIDRQSIPGNTGGGLDNDEASPGPIMIQGDHGPVEFRRITITPAKS
jgi:Domain of Unknown Function (DUF1080)